MKIVNVILVIMFIGIQSFSKTQKVSALESVKRHLAVRGAISYAQSLNMTCTQPSLLERKDETYKFLVSCESKEVDTTGGGNIFIEIELEHSDDLSILKNIHFEYAG